MTDREIFERNGYLEIPKLIIDPINLFVKPPKNQDGHRMSGCLKHFRRKEPEFVEAEPQVAGSFSVYNNPSFRKIHRLVRREVENILKIEENKKLTIINEEINKQENIVKDAKDYLQKNFEI